MPSHTAVRTLLRQRLALLLMTVALPAAAILPLLTALPSAASSTPTLLGEQSFYTLDRHQLWDKADLAVNVASGDLLLHEKDLAIGGIAGHNLNLDRYYNSLSNGAGGGADFGSDWVMSAGGDVKLTIGVGTITYQGPSSFQQVFNANGSAWQEPSPSGLDATLAGASGGPYTLTYHNNGQVLTFNGTGQLTSNADRNSAHQAPNTFTYAYNGDGTLHQVTDASGRTVSFTYNGGGNVATMVDNSLARTYTYTINGSHNLTGYADPANPTKTAVFGYDTLGKHELVDITDPAGTGHTHLVYDTNHRVTELDFTKDSLGGTYQRLYAYNSGTGTCTVSPAPAGNTVVTDENGAGHTTTYCWDSSGRVVQKIDAVGDTTTTVWNSDDKPTSITDPNGNTTTYQYMDTFAPNENLTLVRQPTGAATTYTYGASTNHYAPTRKVQPDGTTFTYAYDANGDLSTMTNGNSSQNTVTNNYYLNGELYGVSDAKGDSTTNCGASPFYYTQCSNYDGNGAVTLKYGSAPLTSESYGRDGASRMTSHTDGNNNLTTYQYDAADRVTFIFYAGTTTCSSSTTCTQFQYDADGNLLSMTDSTGTTTYTQDKLNRLATQTESGSTRTTYTLDGAGNLTQLANGAGTAYYYYDNANHLISMKDPGGRTITFQVDKDGRRTQTAYPNSVSLAMAYDASERLTTLSSTLLPSTLLTNWTYTYTSPGSQDTNLRYTANQSVAPTSSWSNSYNVMDNLTQSQGLTSAYDPNANICGSACGTGQSMTYQPSSALAGWNSYVFGSDHNGNLTTITGGGANVGMSYNAKNQMSSECNGCPSTTTSYTYRGVGQADRASATGVYGTQTWASDLLGVSTETNTAAGTGCTCYYVHDPSGTLIEEILTTGGTAGTYYPTFDGEGSVVALTNSSGSVVDTFSYQQNGVTRASTGSVYEPWQFHGGYADNSQGGAYQAGAYQYHNGARYYEAGQMNGHWTQADGVSSPFATHGWNGYSYAGGDTANLTDQNGLCSWSWLDWTGCIPDAAGNLMSAVGGAATWTAGHASNFFSGSCNRWGVAVGLWDLADAASAAVGGTALAIGSALAEPFSFGTATVGVLSGIGIDTGAVTLGMIGGQDIGASGC